MRTSLAMRTWLAELVGRIWRGNSQAPSTTIDMILNLSCTEVEAVAAGTNTYYLTAAVSSGVDQDIIRMHLTAMYFSTAYGAVAVAVSPVSPSGSDNQIR